MNIKETVKELVADANAQEACCCFHGAGGAHDLACGGDLPKNSGRHSRHCAYHCGGDCTCDMAANW